MVNAAEWPNRCVGTKASALLGAVNTLTWLLRGGDYGGIKQLLRGMTQAASR